MQNFLDAFETPKRSVISGFYNLHDALFNDDSIFVTDIASVFSLKTLIHIKLIETSKFVVRIN